MNNNTKARRREEHKRHGLRRQEDRFRNKQAWLEKKIEALRDQPDTAIANLIGWSMDKLNKYRYWTNRSSSR
jgi:uncharacterized alpha/beta hydrolase family protein